MELQLSFLSIGARCCSVAAQFAAHLPLAAGPRHSLQEAACRYRHVGRSPIFLCCAGFCAAREQYSEAIGVYCIVGGMFVQQSKWSAHAYDRYMCVDGYHSNTLAAAWIPDMMHSLQQRVPWYILSDRLSSILSDFVKSELLADPTFGWCGWRMESVFDG